MGWITRDSHIAGREDVKLGPLRSDVTMDCLPNVFKRAPLKVHDELVRHLDLRGDLLSRIKVTLNEPLACH